MYKRERLYHLTNYNERGNRENTSHFSNINISLLNGHEFILIIEIDTKEKRKRHKFASRKSIERRKSNISYMQSMTLLNEKKKRDSFIN